MTVGMQKPDGGSILWPVARAGAPSFMTPERRSHMLKLTIAALAVALASTAAAAWRDLRIDGGSEANFAESIEAFKEELPRARRYVFVLAMQDIWVHGVEAAKATDREYTAVEYVRQTNGLGYDEVVTLLDPTGRTARARYREGSRLYAHAAPEFYPSQQNSPESFTYQTPQMIEHALQPAQ
jgi:hypothetical protein